VIIINHAEETLPRFQESKKLMEVQHKLLAELYGAKRDLSKSKGAFEHKFHGAKRALENSQALLSNGDKHISILEKMLTTATFAKKLAEKLLELQEECIGLGSRPEGHEKKMAFILTRLDDCYVETAGSMEELNKTRDEQDKLGAWAKNMLHHHGQIPEDPEKVFKRTKVEAELLKKKQEIAAKRQARKEK
jgi:uncharacterized coiled-coil DUF342 family protein